MHAPQEPTECSSLLGDPEGSEDIIPLGSEMLKLSRDSILLVAANLLQFALNMSTIVVISPLGKVELGAASVATTTANITGFIVFQGLATSLDTLCAQAWGSGQPQLVKLHVQRMILLLASVGVFVATTWWLSEHVFQTIIPDAQTSAYAALYLKTLIFAIPGYIVFEAGKRTLTAEGIFLPITAGMCIGVMTNVGLSWFLVWHTSLGYVGAPIAVAITWAILAVYLLALLSATGRGLGLNNVAQLLSGWSPMVRLALPGLIMVEAEYFAFEILVVVAAQISTASLAAQTILATINSAFWQMPFSIGIAGTTRIAQHMGAGAVPSAKRSASIVLSYAFFCSAASAIMLFSFRTFWPLLFTHDQEVIELATDALPVVALMHLFDGLAACCNALLRGVGRPAFGGWTNLLCYYGVALPLSLWSAFRLHWNLAGLWAGVSVALIIVVSAELLFLKHIPWEAEAGDVARGEESNIVEDAC